MLLIILFTLFLLFNFCIVEFFRVKVSHVYQVVDYQAIWSPVYHKDVAHNWVEGNLSGTVMSLVE